METWQAKSVRLITVQGGKQKQKTTTSKPNSFDVVFFLVAAKGLNNDRYNEENVGWLVKHRACIR